MSLARRIAKSADTGPQFRCCIGVAMWSRPLALALLLLPAPALADVKEKVAALASSGLVLVVDGKGNELVAQNADDPPFRPQLPRS